ncbi:hypothetical protein [Pontibacter burrus]|uniref:Uncharacterized protein n=1 Tax=Pontibacter burrus TaxID=2704466 RepID=A0A6B3M080_9BACT|nr:hypothetical protein [Pontibacter burrus]NEM99330.1 hypothetical protein [Pontibacter burrus]
MKLKALLLVVPLLLNSCYSYTPQRSVNTSQSQDQIQLKEQMDSWIGATKHQLLLKWGTPAVTTSDGNGGEIIKFEKLKRAYLQTMGGYITVVHNYSFYVGEDNMIYHWKYDRNQRQGM